jgi:hypothetical protein
MKAICVDEKNYIGIKKGEMYDVSEIKNFDYVTIKQDRYEISVYKKECFQLYEGASKMKYKVGDKVKVRSDLEIGKNYGKQVYVKDMDNLKDNTVTIKSINTDKSRFWENGYRIEELGYTWTDEMFEEVENKIMKISKWEELHKTEQKEKGEEFIIEVLEVSSNISQICIQKRECNNLNMLTRIYSDQPTEKILSVLKCYGFDIEFQAEPTLTEEEFCFLSCFASENDYEIKRGYSKIIGIHEGIRYLIINPDLFQFIKEGESWKVEDLLKLKRKGE